MTRRVIYVAEFLFMQSQRLISCLLLLQGKRRMTARELSTELDVSMRTVYRDVEALCAAGVPIYMERGPFGGIVLGSEFRQALAQFTDAELQALFVVGPGPMSDVGIGSHASALQKLAGALPAMQRRAAEASRDRVLVDHNRWSRSDQPTDALVNLRTAIDRSRCTRLHYRDRSGALSTRIVDPLGLVAKAGVWYLIARERGKGYRTFRAERIAAIDELVDSFERPPDFNLEAFWNESVRSIEGQSMSESYEVVLRMQDVFLTKLVPYWDTVVERKDESTSTLRITFPTRDIAIAKLLVVAEWVEIVSPAQLPSAIVERAQRAIQAYAQS